MKNIILMRHGIYFRADGSDPSLSKEGITEVFDLSRNLKELFELDAIYYSPATRTKETALIVNYVTGAKKMINAPWLYEHDNSIEDLRYLDEKASTVCLVTHSPNMDDIMGFLCNNREYQSYANRKSAHKHGLMGKAVTIEFHINDWLDLGRKHECRINYVSGKDIPSCYEEVKEKIYNLEIKHL